ncbi:MAG: HAD-IC family P-type ATPase [Acidaminococcales bacterium]|jgi:cation-transporting ATPase E|nr:HAD-IC family P-type ATPase [Acidaminococcales bacterium]
MPTEGRFFPEHAAGLTLEEVARQKSLGRQNTAPEKITRTNGQIVKDNLATLFNFYNFLIALFLLLVGAYANIAFISIIVVNIAIGVAQEIHAKNLVEKLSLMNMPKTTVVRGGAILEAPVEELVLDDVVIFDGGRQISVDSVVLYGEAEVNESLLTGESDLVAKKPGDHLLSGSFVVSGKCYARVEHVGIDNYAAAIAHEAKKHKEVNSELLRSMRKVTNFTSFLIVPLGACLFLEAFFWRRDDLQFAVVSSAAALLGMLPKGLVLLISVALASGVIALAKRKILVQELFALESLAHVDILCLDKTGTITEGKMSVQAVHVLEGAGTPLPFERLIGSFLGNSDDNNATYLALKEYFAVNGDLPAARKIPFSSQRKWSAVTFAGGGTLVLGAPERLSEAPLPEAAARAEAAGGRVLMAGYGERPPIGNELPGLVPLAYIVLSDPVRRNAPETLAYFKEQGVEIKIISGDNPLTVSAIAKNAGLETYANFVDMSGYAEESDVKRAAAEYSVFGRVSPLQKKLIVRALKEAGHIVAMAGDGVNDVLALREADCSVALAGGSDAARQVSKLVLLNSDFSSLLYVLAEGRRVVNNITRAAGIFFVKTIYSVLLSALCVVFNIPFPLIPLQGTLMDLTIEGFPSFSMSFQKDNKKITGTFLRTVLRRAFPNALAVILAVLATHFAAARFGLARIESITILYGIIGFIGVQAVFKASRPFDRFRAVLCAATTIGFFGGMLLFHEFLLIKVPQGRTLTILIVMAAASLPAERLFALITDRIMAEGGAKRAS